LGKHILEHDTSWIPGQEEESVGVPFGEEPEKYKGSWDHLEVLMASVAEQSNLFGVAFGFDHTQHISDRLQFPHLTSLTMGSVVTFTACLRWKDKDKFCTRIPMLNRLPVRAA